MLLLSSMVCADDLWIGMGVGWQPDFEGSDDFRTVPLPTFKYRNEWVEIQPNQLGLEADVFPGQKFDFGPIVRFGTGRNDRRSIDDPVIRRMRKVEDAFEMGGFFSGGVPIHYIGIDDNGIVATRIDVIQGIAEGHKGTTVEGALRFVRPFSDVFRMVFSFSAAWASDRYQRAFFSVSPEDAARSGLPEFEADSGVKNIGFAVAARYQFNTNWRISSAFRYQRLVGDAADSPIVTLRGDRDQPFFGVILEYKVF